MIENLKDVLEVDVEFIKYLEDLVEKRENASESDWGHFSPENFWFYHNGISIYSYEKILLPANQIYLCPDKVSVINGAQTLTNFFLEVESIERLLNQFFERKDISVKSIIDSIIKTIYVKTIIINGDDKLVRPITHGLNTQIPILEEALLSDSETSDNINKILARCSNISNRIRILKEGEIWTGDCGVNVLDFVKHWFTIHKEPGKSKNLAKSQLKEILKKIEEILEKDTSSIKQMEVLFQVYKWWDAARTQRIIDHSDEESVVIGKYGRNYFGSYVVNALEGSIEGEYLDDAHFTILYESFLKDMKLAKDISEYPINLGAFKKDELSSVLFEIQMKHQGEKERGGIVYPERMEEELQELLNKDGQNVYSFSKTIADYLIANNVVIDYFRVISRTEKKCKEAFPFPNATFTEIVDSFEMEKDSVEISGKKAKVFEESIFSKAIRRTFPVFVIDKNESISKNTVSKVHFIQEFSFIEFEAEAKRVYDQTIEAFKNGDENAFPKSGGKLYFHIRPKAVNAEDTFQFTNGNYITKRTFWANKNTVEAIINKVLEKG